MNESIAIRRNIRLNLKQGLHIRVCSFVVSIVSNFQGHVRILNGERSADANSMFDLIQLAAAPQSELIVEATGDNSESVLDELEHLFSLQSLPSD